MGERKMDKEKISILVLAMLLGIANVCLNFAGGYVAHKTESQKFTSSLLTWPFLLAFLIGMCSLLSLVGVYKAGAHVPTAIVLAGTVSIIFGTAVSCVISWLRKEAPGLSQTEWILFALLISVFIIKWKKILT
jgi:hypothetical protein